MSVKTTSICVAFLLWPISIFAQEEILVDSLPQRLRTTAIERVNATVVYNSMISLLLQQDFSGGMREKFQPVVQLLKGGTRYIEREKDERNLAVTYGGLGNLRLALDLHQNIEGIQQIISDEELSPDIENVALKFELQESERDNAALAREAESQSEIIIIKQKLINKQKYLILAISAGMLLVGLTAFLYYRRYLENKRLNKQLRTLNDEIKAKHEYIARMNEKIRKQHVDLVEKSEEIGTQNLQLQKKNSLIHLQNRQLKKNERILEMKVEERTRELQSFTKTLIHKNSQLEEFAFIASHGLKAPLVSLKGLYHLGSLSPQNKEIVAMTRREINNLIGVVGDLNDVLDTFSRVNDKMEWLDFERCMEQVLRRLQTKIDTSGITINTDIRVEKIYTIRFYLENILYELVDNAIKFGAGDAPSEVVIQADEHEDHYRISVSDEGIGLDVEQFKDKLFKPYQRFNLDRPGKGLGLYLVKYQLEQLDSEATLIQRQERGLEVDIRLRKKSDIPDLVV